MAANGGSVTNAGVVTTNRISAGSYFIVNFNSRFNDKIYNYTGDLWNGMGGRCYYSSDNSRKLTTNGTDRLYYGDGQWYQYNDNSTLIGYGNSNSGCVIITYMD